MIKNHSFIVSTVTDILRSEEEIFGSTTSGVYVNKVNTALVDEFSFTEYTNLMISSDLTDYYAAASMDSMFVPYTTNYDHTGVLPRFERPTDETDVNVYSLNPFNPNHIFGTGVLNTGVVDTGVFNTGVWVSSGHNIAYSMTASQYATEESIESGVHPGSTHFDADFYNRGRTEIRDVRAIAHRAPMILSGFGYDTDGGPVPSSGEIWNTELWKTGPLDVRWDNGRKVWTGGSTTKIFLVKLTNTYNPKNFSYEVERSNSRDQYTRIGPATAQVYSTGNTAIYDPELLAYSGNPDNQGSYEYLNYTGVDFPFYEAFIIRETSDDVGNEYYNIWTEDCQDCGHVTNPCQSPTNQRILIENPLKQSFDAGDLAFTVKTGRSKLVNTGSFIGGSGVDATASITTDGSGVASVVVETVGSGYIYGGFGIVTSDICASVQLYFNAGTLASGVVVPSSGYDYNKTYNMSIYPTNAQIESVSLPIHWVTQSEFKTQQVVTHVECDGGIMQTCSVKVQTQGMKSCEFCGDPSTLINSF